jgi:hypothetical protein
MAEKQMTAEEYANMQMQANMNGETWTLVVGILLEHAEAHPEDKDAIDSIEWTRVQ